jgi:hypothetical protein
MSKDATKISADASPPAIAEHLVGQHKSMERNPQNQSKKVTLHKRGLR